jgi:hypothetical protein
MSSITTEDQTYDPGLRSGTLIHLNFLVVSHNVTANLAEFQTGLQSVRVLCGARPNIDVIRTRAGSVKCEGIAIHVTGILLLPANKKIT